MKKTFFVLLLLVSMYFPLKAQESPCKNSAYILEKSVAWHDPSGHWDQFQAKLYIQEPRPQNPPRYSIVTFDNASAAFELLRNRDQYLCTYQVSADGKPNILLDGQENFSADLVEKYRLVPQRSLDYKNFYSFMYGLPMSFIDKYKTLENAQTTVFNGQAALVVETELKEAMISKHWRLFFHLENYKFLGIEILDMEKPGEGERIVFDGSIHLQGMRLPRMHHWYELKTYEYSGSDIIVKEMKE